MHVCQNWPHMVSKHLFGDMYGHEFTYIVYNPWFLLRIFGCLKDTSMLQRWQACQFDSLKTHDLFQPEFKHRSTDNMCLPGCRMHQQLFCTPPEWFSKFDLWKQCGKKWFTIRNTSCAIQQQDLRTSHNSCVFETMFDASGWVMLGPSRSLPTPARASPGWWPSWQKFSERFVASPTALWWWWSQKCSLQHCGWATCKHDHRNTFLSGSLISSATLCNWFFGGTHGHVPKWCDIIHPRLLLYHVRDTKSSGCLVFRWTI